MKKIKPFLIICSLFFGLLLSACGTATPTLSAEEKEAQLATMVAATVEAALASPNTDEVPAAPVDGEPASAAEATAAPAPIAPAAPAPVFYPDFPGLRVAYVKDGNVYVWTEGGSSVGLTGTGDVRQLSISSDGERIAYVRELIGAPFAFELWVVNADGGVLNPQLLVGQAEMVALKDASESTFADGFDFDQIEFRPGTHDLYFSTVPRFMGPGYAPNYDLRMVNVDTLDKFMLFDFDQAGAFSFSPDGAQMALSTPDHISLVNADGSNLRSNVLTYPLVGTYSEYQYRPSPIWAVDSMSLRVAIPPEDTLAEPTPPTTLWYLPTDGTAATQLGIMNAIPFDWPDYAFSPNMSYVAYIKSIGEPTENQRELHIAYPDGSGDTVFATGTSLQFLGWTPDSTRFTYALNSTEDSGLYLGSVAGGVSIISSVHQTMRQVRWVGNDRIIFIYDNPNTNASELRISDQSSANKHAFIDTLTVSFPSYDFTK